MKTRTNIRTLQAMFLALMLIMLTACGGGNDSEATVASSTSPAPGTVPLTATQISLAQAVLDIVTTALDSSVAFTSTTLDAVQAEFDQFVITLVATGAGGILSGVDIQAAQDTLDVYTTTTDGSAGALSAVQIQLAQDALDSFLP